MPSVILTHNGKGCQHAAAAGAEGETLAGSKVPSNSPMLKFKFLKAFGFIRETYFGFFQLLCYFPGTY